MGALAGKTRILVTHQLELLPTADLTVVITDGTIVAQGKYTDLMANNSDFSTLINTVLNNEQSMAPSPRTGSRSGRKRPEKKEESVSGKYYLPYGIC